MGKDGRDHDRYYAPVAWDSTCQPKRNGSAGFRKAHDQKILPYMLPKMAWLFTTSKSSLTIWIKWTDQIGTTLPFGKEIHARRETFTLNCCKKIERRQNTRIWFDHWIPSSQNFEPLPKNHDIGTLQS